MSIRNIVDVIGTIQDLVPADETLAHHQLTYLRRRVGYTPPELAGPDWGELSRIVNSVVGPPPLSEEWRINTVAALMNTTADQIRADFGTKENA